MKKSIILGLAAAGISVSSMTALATSESKYPAADFQPKVVYIDQEAAASASSAAGDSSKCPGQQAKVKQTEFDPKFPAASFEPKVVYP